MGLRREILEEIEEKENANKPTSTEPTPADDSDRDIHGIGWNIFYDKFVKKD